ncbi:hypothetical protein [Cryptosporangium phraense]|uniref:Uncharacterized protein n=1 Tax=Cryptosporangium phraense TaxID=2593070 RepID=A0A545AW33_9ACTN|nr:hypothetical protein [Cryptosporangium phraense]TQS45546.1 hypothetical protein FL583_07355 [Cryptosporangium phraense]
MPSSVLLALVVAAGVLILMPALAHRYDTALRGQAELRASSMRVLPRERRRRTVPSGGPVRPPTSLIVPAAVRTAHGVTAEGRDLTAVRASLVREVLDGAGAGAPVSGARTRVRVRRPANGNRPTSAVPIPVSAMPVAANRPVSVVPAPPSARPTVVPAAAVRRAAELQRARRRRLVLILAALVVGQAVVGLFLGAAFLIGAVVSAVVAAGLLGRLRAVAAERQKREAQERHAQALVARARAHRAEAFVRRALRQVPAGADREAWLGSEAVGAAAGWLAMPRAERERPARDVVRVLAAAGREVYLAADGAWAVRPVAVATRDSVRRDAVARREARAAEARLPRVVNG